MQLRWASIMRLQLVRVVAHLMHELLLVHTSLGIVNSLVEEVTSAILAKRTGVGDVGLQLGDRLQSLLVCQGNFEFLLRDERMM